MPEQPCKICSSTDTRTFTLGNTSLVRCASCDAVFQAKIPSTEEIAEYYRSNYRLKSNTDDTAYERRRMFRLPEQVKLVADLQRLMPPPASLLDIGCDRGFFLDEARHHGYSITGIEPSENAREYCARIGISVVADIADLSERFDAATMHHVLEHITDPVRLLREIHERLNPGGVLLVRVPNFDTIWRSVFRSRWFWFQQEAHYFHYTPRSLRRLLEGSGFRIEWIRSQRPNDLLTMRANHLANHTYRRYFGIRLPLRKRLGRLYEDLVGVELYAAAVKC